MPGCVDARYVCVAIRGSISTWKPRSASSRGSISSSMIVDAVLEVARRRPRTGRGSPRDRAARSARRAGSPRGRRSRGRARDGRVRRSCSSPSPGSGRIAAPVWMSIEGSASSSILIWIGISMSRRQRAALGRDRRREVGGDDQAAVRAGEPDVALDRVGQAEVVAEVDRRRRRLVVASRAGLVGQQTGDVPDEWRCEGPARGHRRTGSRASSSSNSGWAGQPASGSSVPFSSSARRSERRASSRSMPLLDALEGLDDVALEPDEHVDGVLVGAAADVLGVGLGVGDDAAALGLGLLGQPALVDEERGLLLGAGDDPLRLLLGLLDDPLALGVDALRRADLFGDGDAELVDEAERGRPGRRRRCSSGEASCRSR